MHYHFITFIATLVANKDKRGNIMFHIPFQCLGNSATSKNKLINHTAEKSNGELFIHASLSS